MQTQQPSMRAEVARGERLYRGGQDLIGRLEEITDRSDFFIPYFTAVILLLGGIPFLAHVSTPLTNGQMAAGALLILLALSGGIPVKRWSEQRRTASLVYDLTRPDIRERQQHVETLGRALGGVERLSKMSGRASAEQVTAGDEVVQPRLAARCLQAGPSRVRLNVRSWGVVAGSERIWLLPDCILIEQDHRLHAVTYDKLRAEATGVRRVEWDRVARDTRVIEEQWRVVKPGGERGDEIRDVVLCEFGELCITGPDGWELVLQASDPNAVSLANRCLQELIRASQVENGTVPAERPAPPAPPAPSAGSAASAAGAATAAAAPLSATARPSHVCASCGFDSGERVRFCPSCGGVQYTLKEGLVLRSRYVLLGELGRGAVGTTYRVWDTTGQKALAMKEMRGQGKSAQERLDASVRFEAEGQMLLKIEHPSLPRVLDHFTEGGCSYLVMELVGGESLLEGLKRDGEDAGLAEETVREMADQILDAFEFLHGQVPPIFFCGLQPGLIMRPEKPTDVVAEVPPLPNAIRLADFGVARSVQGFAISTDLDAAGYAAPELYRGQVEARSDLYGLGATLYHLLSGQAPGEKPHYPPIRTLVPHVSEQMERVLQRALQGEPEHRFESASQMRAALRGEGIDLSGPGGSVVRHIEREYAIRVDFTHKIVTNGMCHSVGFTPDGGRLLTGCYDVRLWDTVNFHEVRRDDSGKGATCSAQLSQDGRLLAYGALDGCVYLQGLQLLRETNTLTGHVDQIASLAFSPNGQMLASAALDGTLRLWDVVEASSFHTLSVPGHLPRAVAFSPDGTRVVSAFSNLLLWDVGTGALVRHLPVEKLGGVSIRALAYSPDGKLLACACSDASVRLFEADTLQAVQRLDGHASQVLSVAFAPIGWLLASGAGDSTTRLWDVESGEELHRLEGHTSAVSSVAWSQDGRRLATGAWDLTARLYTVTYDRSETFKAPATRLMTS